MSEQASELTREMAHVLMLLRHANRLDVQGHHCYVLHTEIGVSQFRLVLDVIEKYLSTTSDQARNADQAVEPAELGAVAWIDGNDLSRLRNKSPPFDEVMAFPNQRHPSDVPLYTHPSPWRERLMGLADEWDGRGKHLIESQATIYDYVAHELREVIESLAAQP